jgi:hypothetical protein
MNLSPIVIFVYNRLEHTSRTVDALLRNALASDSDLIVFSDAARTPESQPDVIEVRAYLKKITGFRSVTIHHRPCNLGLAKSIISGVTEVLEKYECVIVLEDDLVTSPYFLTYMNEALVKYAGDDRVISIHGYVYPVMKTLPEAFFLRGADCWGWATWRRGWNLFNPSGQLLMAELKGQGLMNKFNFNGTYSFSHMLEQQIKGANDSWAVRWYASAFLANKLTLYPGRSLVHNIGNDGSGVHCDKSSAYDVFLSLTPIDLNGIQVEPSIIGFKAFEGFFGQYKIKIIQRMRGLIARIF